MLALSDNHKIISPIEWSRHISSDKQRLFIKISGPLHSGFCSFLFSAIGGDCCFVYYDWLNTSAEKLLRYDRKVEL